MRLININHMNHMNNLNKQPEQSDEQLEWVQAFVCDVYGHEGKDVNLLIS